MFSVYFKINSGLHRYFKINLGLHYMSSSIRCELCHVDLSSEAQLAVHVKGKKHQKKAVELHAFTSLAKRSIFISGVPKNTFSSEQQVA